MVSDQEIAKGVEILLSQSDPKSFTTLNDVVQQLGHKLGFDLSHKAAFISNHISHLLFRSHHQHHHPPPPPPPPQPHPHPQPQQHLQPQQQQQQQQQQQASVAHRLHPVTSSGITKEHFILQQQQQQQAQAQFHFGQQQAHHYPVQYHHPHFPVQQQHQHQQPQQQQRQRHPVELNFGNPAAQQAVVHPPIPHQQPLLDVKVEGGGGGVFQNAVAKSSEKPKKSASTGNKRRGGPGGLNKLCGISPELQVIVGESALSRTDIVKQLWAYIKKNNLQDPGNKRKIICDDALRVVFETDCTDMFKMNKLLAKHIIRLEPTKESSRKRSKVIVEPKAENTDIGPIQVRISEQLADCLALGTGERDMSQSEALRLVWKYIQDNNLEDPQNPVMVKCDPKLRELFGCESISTMGIPEMLVRHHLFER